MCIRDRIIAGGVAANKSIRSSLKQLETIENCEFLFPSIKYCTDNGAMIALAGIERFERSRWLLLRMHLWI
mgnify:CR=1 FL=1